MNYSSPDSSLSSLDSPLVPTRSMRTCEICDKPSHGKHFGAVTCRACAMFFRRFGRCKNMKPCEMNNNCQFPKNGYFNCKKCRLQKCWDVGMTTDTFQSVISKLAKPTLQVKIPETIGTLIGLPNLIIFNAPEFEAPSSICKNFIDVRYLVSQGEQILRTGLETPIIAQNSLEKMALGLEYIRKMRNPKINNIRRIGQKEVFTLWQDDFLKTAKWLTYFSEFQQLPDGLQMKFLKSIWKLWSRFERLVTTMIGRRNSACSSNMVLIKLDDTQVVFDIKKIDVDVSWQSRYNVEQLKLFGYSYLDEKYDEIIQEMIDLDPTNVELSFMVCQLCLHHIGKKFQGDILKVAERLQSSIANNLHDYYVNKEKRPRYSGRIAKMMKINNYIQKGIYERRVKADLMRVFDVFHVEYSDPDMFEES
ncbi:Nuclear Hormone Receptor family [Caenorhabditis elegans]|uniref:Nuclear Hormone Receptor family n=2 Tax=Caenorhabditis elegans TaxID=6239 RepID=Q966H4_CAEEL|nr:Nuclear Hormone Receptor family [Caenorhabditis elegans]CCD62234.1 Nuclear Hormone Receptor family [Caenorhabditis elegans]|eukprot:NP_503214.1 Nuclear Hormone Receptor family [Caenorhabditis elegans]